MEKLQATGFVEVEVLDRGIMAYEDLKPYPLYALGVLDQLFAAIAPEWRDKLMGRITVRGTKPGSRV